MTKAPELIESLEKETKFSQIDILNYDGITRIALKI